MISQGGDEEEFTSGDLMMVKNHHFFVRNVNSEGGEQFQEL